MEELRNKDGLTEKEFLEQYNPGDYERPAVTSDIIIFSVKEDYSNLRLLLIQRGNHPCIGSWALPGGFINENETALQAAGRELEEETGLKDIYLDQLYAFTKPNRDPRTWVMSVAYLALIPNLLEVEGADDASDAAWFDLKCTEDTLVISNESKEVWIGYSLKKEIQKNGPVENESYIPTLVSKKSLAFDHVEMILEALKKLREQVRYGNQAFCFLEETFTLPELQAVYEAVLGRQIDKKSLKEMIKGKVVETGETKKSRTKHGKQVKEYRLI